MTVVDKATFCRICGSVCGLVVGVEDGRVVRVRGDNDNPLSRGYACAKGRALGALHHHAERLDHPELRGGTGELVRVPWDECLDDLASRLERVRSAAGPDAVAVYTATGNVAVGFPRNRGGSLIADGASHLPAP